MSWAFIVKFKYALGAGNPMAVFDFLKKEEAAPAPQASPIEFALSLKRQGLTNNQIIQTLQRQGYSQQQIYDAMTEAEARESVQLPPGQIVQPPPEQAEKSHDDRYFEQLAEKIVEDKWREMDALRKEDQKWKDATEDRIAKLEQGLTDLKNDVANLHKSIVSKVSDYDQNLMSVGTEIKAMEKVFQQILPTLSQNVEELSKITKDIKKKKA